MDLSKLTPFQLIEFLQLYKITPQTNNLIGQAQQLFNQVTSQFGNRAVFTDPVIDLYIASNFKGAISQKYTPQAIRNLSPKQLQQFAAALGLSSISSERLIRILNFLNALDLSSSIGEIPSEIDYLIALNLDYFSLLHYCETSVKYVKICRDGVFWRLKAEHDFGISSSTQTFNIANGKEEYIKIAAQHKIPVPGVEKYIVKSNDIIDIWEAAFKTGNQKLIDYFARRRDIIPLDIARLAGEYANREIINEVLNHPRFNEQYRNNILYGAAEGGHRNIVQEMMKLGITNVGPAIMLAARGGYLDIINDLARQGIEPIYLNKALIEAADNGHLDVVKEMVKFGATDYNNAMVTAAENGHLDIIEEMVKNGANDFNRGLIRAATIGNLDATREMLRLGANNFEEALRTALRNQNEEVADEIRKWIEIY